MPTLRIGPSRLVFVAATLLLFGCATTKQDTATAGSPSKAAFPVAPQHQSLIATLVEHEEIAAAFKTIEADRRRNIDLLVELTEIPAPPFGEHDRAKRFASLLREAGLDDVSLDDVGNVIGRRAGTKGKRTIAIAAHLDTVFPIETDVSVKITGDTYTAPGIGDNTRGLVVVLSLLKALQDHGIATESDLLFIGNVGEEGLGDLKGVRHLYRDGAPPIDALVAIDGGKTNRLIYSGIGSNRYRIAIEGPGGHSWGAFGDANPHHALARATALFAERAPDITSSGPKTSFNVGRIGGGTSINSIPFESWMEVDMRSGDKSKLSEIDSVLKQAVEDGLLAENNARQRGPELTADIQNLGIRPAGRGDPGSPLVQHAMAAMQALGVSPNLTSSSTDANIPIALGLPAITLSRGGVSQHAHSLNETWTDKDSHIAIQIALLVLLAQAGHSTP